MGKIQITKIFFVVILVLASISCSSRREILNPAPTPDLLLLQMSEQLLMDGKLIESEKYVKNFLLIFPQNKNYYYALYILGEINFERGFYYKSYHYFLMSKKYNSDSEFSKKIISKIRELESILNLQLLSGL